MVIRLWEVEYGNITERRTIAGNSLQEVVTHAEVYAKSVIGKSRDKELIKDFEITKIELIAEEDELDEKQEEG